MATQINFFYASYCKQFMTLNIDEKSLFISIPSESNGISYRVDMNEETMQVEKCSCQGFRYHSHCKHETIVSEEYAACSQSFIVNAAMDEAEAIEEAYAMAEIAEQVQAAPIVETPTVRKLRKVATPLVRKSGNKLVLVNKAKSPVAKIIEQAVQATVPTAKVTDVSNLGNLYSNRGFSLMR
jgi:hypothetical protein